MNFSRRSLIRLPAIAATAALAPLCAPHLARAAGRKLRVGHTNSATSSLQFASTQFGDFVRERTDGRWEVEVYPNAQLGNDAMMIKAVSDSTLDGTVCSAALLGNLHPDIDLLSLPFLFRDALTARKALTGALGAHYTEIVAKNGMTAIGWGETGMRHITANKPIRTVADLKDVKIRVQASRIHMESFLGLGARPGPLTFNELPEAFRTGRFDAHDNPVSVIIANDFIPKYQSHLSLSGHMYSPTAILFSPDVLEDMTPADRAVVQAGGLLAVKATWTFNDEAAVTGLDKLKAAGMTVVADFDRPGFEKAMTDLGPRLAAVVDPGSLARVRALVA